MSPRAQLLLSALMLLCCQQMVSGQPAATPTQPPTCGGDPIDYKTMMCCQQEPVVIEFPPAARPFLQCCGDVILDNRTMGCCAQEAFMNQEGVCCGGTLHGVDPLSWGCCGGSLFEKSITVNCCANSDIYDITEEICCAGQIAGYPALSHTCCGQEALLNGGSRRCCGPRTSYDFNVDMCCQDTVVQGATVCPTQGPTTPGPTVTGATGAAPIDLVLGGTAAPVGTGTSPSPAPIVQSSPLADHANHNVPAGAAPAAVAAPIPRAFDLPRPMQPPAAPPGMGKRGGTQFG